MNENIVNNGINWGHKGRLYIYQNVQPTVALFKRLLEQAAGGLNGSSLRISRLEILMLELFNQYAEGIYQEFDKEIMFGNKNPLRIKVTRLVNACAQGVLNNDRDKDRDVCYIVDSIITLACVLKCGDGFYAERVKVGDQLYYMLYPTGE